jgi:hypothetical protein
MEDELIKTMEIFKIENRLEMLNKKLESSLPFEKCYISFEIIKLKEKKQIMERRSDLCQIGAKEY